MVTAFIIAAFNMTPAQLDSYVEDCLERERTQHEIQCDESAFETAAILRYVVPEAAGIE